MYLNDFEIQHPNEDVQDILRTIQELVAQHELQITQKGLSTLIDSVFDKGINLIKTTSYNDGYEDGYEEQGDKRYDEGYSEGYETGYAEGYAETH